jgi:hypothetical protein
MMGHPLSKEAPGLLIDVVFGMVGFLLAISWGKVSGRQMDRDTVLFLAKMFGGITVFGAVLLFVM